MNHLHAQTDMRDDERQPAKPIRVAVVEDDRATREGLGMRVAGSAGVSPACSEEELCVPKKNCHLKDESRGTIMNPKIATRRVALLLMLFALCTITALAQTTSFTYQGRLTDGGTAANGNYDLQFTLWDALSGGTQQPQPSPVTVARSAVAVANGIFTVQLDFGATAFPGANRFLEISAKLMGAGSFTTLAPRQPITSTPYAIRSLNASTADAVTVSGVPSGSGNYIQNATTQQAGANFNISGNGTAGGTLSANAVNAATQYNISGSRVLSNARASNLFAGVSACANNTNGLFN